MRISLTLRMGVRKGQNKETTGGTKKTLRVWDMSIIFIVITSLVHASGKT